MHAEQGRVFLKSNVLALTAVFSLWHIIPRALAVSCYCTHCDGGVCEADLCLVGFKETRAQIHRDCARNVETPGTKVCSINARHWQEVCACHHTDYCNTYKYFRTNVNTAYETDGSGTAQKFLNNYKASTDYGDDAADSALSNANYFEKEGLPRMSDPYSGEERGYPGENRSESRPGPFNNANLIILLVCVPLGIGAFAVLLIFLNYHCKLC